MSGQGLNAGGLFNPGGNTSLNSSVISGNSRQVLPNQVLPNLQNRNIVTGVLSTENLFGGGPKRKEPPQVRKVSEEEDGLFTR